MPIASHVHVLNQLSDVDYRIRVARGEVPGVSALHKFGLVENIPTINTFVAIWGGGGDYTGHDPTVPETVTVVSSSTQDSATGSGVSQISIEGLCDNWLPVSEPVVLDGTNTVTTSLAFSRVFRANCGLVVPEISSARTNEGVITIAQSITTVNIFAAVPAGYGGTMIAATTVPGDSTLLLDRWAVAIANKKTAAVTARLMVRPYGGIWRVAEVIAINSSGTSFAARKYDIPKNGAFRARADVKIMVDSSATGVDISGTLDGLLVKD